MLLLLHGVGERWDSWAQPELGNIRKIARKLNAVVVMPDGAKGFYMNWWNDAGLGNPEWEYYIREELIPTIERRFSISPARHNHAIAGFSMGGVGATRIGLR